MTQRFIALTLMALAFGAQAAAPESAPQPAAKPDAPRAAQASAPAKVAPADAASAAGAPVKVTGASTVAGAPLLLSLDGKKAAEPSFQELFNVVKTHASWKIKDIKAQGQKSRMTMASVQGKSTLEMDVANDMMLSLRLKAGDTIEAVTQVLGQDALIKFNKDKIPLGFMVNKLEPAKP